VIAACQLPLETILGPKMHECAHSTMAAHRLNRTEAYAKRRGDSACALEELAAEIPSAMLSAETGVPMSQDHARVSNHAGHLRGWIKAIENDPRAIFTAAKNADRICEYMLGLERQMTAMGTARFALSTTRPKSSKHCAGVMAWTRRAPPSSSNTTSPEVVAAQGRQYS